MNLLMECLLEGWVTYATSHPRLDRSVAVYLKHPRMAGSYSYLVL